MNGKEYYRGLTTSKELLLRSHKVKNQKLHEGLGVAHGDQGGPMGSQISNRAFGGGK